MGLLWVFSKGLIILSSINPLNAVPLNTTPFKRVSMTNQECKVRPQIVNVDEDDPVFFLIALEQVNAAVVATISIIHSQNCVFLML